SNFMGGVASNFMGGVASNFMGGVASNFMGGVASHWAWGVASDFFWGLVPDVRSEQCPVMFEWKKENLRWWLGTLSQCRVIWEWKRWDWSWSIPVDGRMLVWLPVVCSAVWGTIRYLWGVVRNVVWGVVRNVVWGVVRNVVWGVVRNVVWGVVVVVWGVVVVVWGVVVVVWGVVRNVVWGVVVVVMGVGLVVIALCLPVALYPFLTGWNILLYQLDKQPTATKPSFLRRHSAFWYEWQGLPLQGLDQHILLVMRRNPEEGQAALKYLNTSRQRWAAQAVEIELNAPKLECCKDVAAIGNAYRNLVLVELNSPVSPLLSRFSRISEDVAAALNQNSAYNQRLALSTVAERLNGLIFQELTRSGDKYAVRFRPIAHSWYEIVTNEVQFGLDARELERCTDVAAIGDAYRHLALGELNSPVDSLLSSFSRISQDVAAALNQNSAYNQRLALTAVAERLNGLSRELTRSGDKYAVRFRPVANSWYEIVTNYVQEQAKAVELRQEINNPYIIGVPLTEQQEIFTGRTDIGTRMEQLLLDRRRPPLLLYGQRRMGKTSLLNNLGRLLPSNIIPMFVDLQGPVSSASDSAGFLYNIARSMADSAKRQSALTVPSLKRETLQDDPFTRFDEWLREVEKALQQNIALLAFDEFEALDNAITKGRFDEEDVLGMLRHLIQHRPRFKVLLAGSHTIEEFQRWASYLINVQVVHISYLKQPEARQLIEQPVQDFTLRYEPNAVDRVLQLTRCHPFLIQLLCAEIIALKNEQDPSIRRLATLADVEAAIPEALSVGSFFFADIQNNQVDAAGLAILQFLAARGEGATVSRPTILQHFPDKSDALNLLLQRELIEEVSEGYRFQVELIRRWFASS
ncbi:AAA family ATPase, partial [Microcoleus sp. ARI1-A5]|uniref:AAA family ATPase n=1 Tax=Microcoleus sp. ARI1-A5 TaxID=2818560 RepID=UPI003FA54FAE